MALRWPVLPPQWEEAKDPRTGRTFFIDHKNQQTTWVDPRHQAPGMSPSALPSELPVGWQMIRDETYGQIFINHIEKKIQAEDPRFPNPLLGKQRMIDAFVSATRASSEKLNLQAPLRSPMPSDPSGVDSELQRSMDNVQRLRRGLNIPTNNDLSNQEQMEHLISRIDNEIRKLQTEVAQTEMEQRQQPLLDVAEKEKELAHASRQHANPSADPASAAEASKNCERLRGELERAKSYNNAKVSRNINGAKKVEKLMEQIHQKQDCKRRLISVLEEPDMRPRRPPTRSQTFSDARKAPDRFAEEPAKGVSLINLNSEERNELKPPMNRLSAQIPRSRVDDSSQPHIHVPPHDRSHLRYHQ